MTANATDQPTSTITIRADNRYFTLSVAGTKKSVRTNVPPDEQGEIVALAILSLLARAGVVEAVVDLNRREVLSVVQGSDRSNAWTAEIRSGGEHYLLVQRWKNGRSTVTIDPGSLTSEAGVRVLCGCLGVLAISAGRTELDITLKISNLEASTPTSHGGFN